MVGQHTDGFSIYNKYERRMFAYTGLTVVFMVAGTLCVLFIDRPNRPEAWACWVAGILFALVASYYYVKDEQWHRQSKRVTLGGGAPSAVGFGSKHSLPLKRVSGQMRGTTNLSTPTQGLLTPSKPVPSSAETKSAGTYSTLPHTSNGSSQQSVRTDVPRTAEMIALTPWEKDILLRRSRRNREG